VASAINTAREQQQARAAAVQTRAEEIRRRTETLSSLLNRWTELGAEAAEIARLAQQASAAPAVGGTNGPVGRDHAVDEVDQRVTQLADQAQELANQARAESFADLAKQADGMRQQLLASQNKMRLARRREEE
jgi:hypothetical protein